MHAKIVIMGPAGCGKTRTGCEILKHLAGEPFGVLDSEHRRIERFSRRYDFQVMGALNGKTGYGPGRYMQAIQDAQKAGLGGLLIDSLSHSWTAPGGILSMVDEARGSPRDDTGWGAGNAAYNRLVNAIIDAPLHIVCTLRCRNRQVRIGEEITTEMRPEHRDGVEYEFDAVFEMDRNHNLWAIKVTEPTEKLEALVVDQVLHLPGRGLAEALIEWLE